MLKLVVPALIAFISSVFVARYSIAVTLKNELKKETESRFNERKWEVYTRFSDLIREVLLSTKAKNDKDRLKKQADLGLELINITSELWLVASNKVLDAFVQYKQITTRQSKDIQDPLAVMEIVLNIIIEMRRDLGYDRTDISTELIMGTIFDMK